MLKIDIPIRDIGPPLYWWEIIINDAPDPASRCHLLRCLRSFLLAAYYSYASVVTPWRLASNTLLVCRILTKINVRYCLYWNLIEDFEDEIFF
jgi:hypothetical protein